MAIRDTRRSANLFRFIDDLTAINDGENLKEVVTKFTLLSLRPWRSKGYPGVFPLDFCIEVEHKKFNIQLYNKEGDFSFLICRMPLLGSNFPSEILYSTFETDAKRLRFRYLECQTTMVKHCFFLIFFKDIE